jgi:hypothetical protein
MELCIQYRSLHGHPIDITKFLVSKIQSNSPVNGTMLYLKRPDINDIDSLAELTSILAVINAERPFKYRYDNRTTMHLKYRNESIKRGRGTGIIRVHIKRPD